VTSNRKTISAAICVVFGFAHFAAAAQQPASQPKRPTGPSSSTNANPITNIALVQSADPFGPIPSPHDSRNVSFVYDSTTIYNLFAQAGQLMQVVLAPDEEIVTIQISDRVRWQVNRVEEGDIAPRLFIKPTQTGLVTTAAIVTAVKSASGITTERIYDVRLESTPEGGKRYQRVQFSYPQVEEKKRSDRRRVEETVQREDLRLKELEIAPSISVESLNWNYTVSGKAPFRPVAVFDDGRFTYLKMPTTTEWPAVFMGSRNDAAIVKTARRGDYIVVQRLVEKLLLKIDDAEIVIDKATKTASWFGGSN